MYGVKLGEKIITLCRRDGDQSFFRATVEKNERIQKSLFWLIESRTLRPSRAVGAKLTDRDRVWGCIAWRGVKERL